MDSTCQNRAKLNNIALCKRSPNPHLTEIQIVTVLKNLNIRLYFYDKILSFITKHVHFGKKK